MQPSSHGFDFAGALGGAGRGAAAGAILGPAGAAVGGLVGLGMAIAPEIGRWIGGKDGEQTAQKVAQTIEEVAGTNDPDLAASAIAEDPEKAISIRVQLAQIAAAREVEWRRYELASFKEELADVQDARTMSVIMHRERSPLAYGAAVVTGSLIVMFGYVIIMNPTLDEGMKETLKVLTVAAASYWIGSSRGSATKELTSSKGIEVGR
jgi:hypothetical protein